MVREEKIKETPNVKTTTKLNNIFISKRQFRDKVVFTLNFTLFILSIIALCKGPVYFSYLNAFSIFIMMIHRIYEFLSYKWQFYLIDYCYVINTLVIVYSIFYPKNYYMFFCAFAFGTGPIFTSIAYYRMGFVFHNTIKMTSLWSHYSPPITMFLIRWFDYNNDFIGTENLNKLSLNFTFSFNYFYECSIFYFSWFFIYYYLIFHLCKNYIKKNKCETQYDYLIRKKDSNKILNVFGQKWSEIVYMLTHVGWVYGNLILALVQLFNFYVGAALVAYLTLVSIWNASSYYMDYFSAHYMKQFKEEGNKEEYTTPI